MARKLTLKTDRLTELTPDELAGVASAYRDVWTDLICVTDQLTICDAQRCAV